MENFKKFTLLDETKTVIATTNTMQNGLTNDEASAIGNFIESMDKLKVKTLIEFIADEEKIDIPSAKTWIEELMKTVIESPLHYGDCTKQNVSCNMCLLEGILNDYYKYRISHTGG